MKKRKIRNLRARKVAMVGVSNLFEALLMCPSEVQDASQACSTILKQALAGSWMLSGTVRNTELSALKQTSPSDVVIFIEAFSMPSGSKYAAVWCDFGGYQHIFLLPLFLERVRKFFASALTGPTHFGFVNEDNEDGVIFDCHDVPREFVSFIESNSTVAHQSTGEILMELIHIVSELTEPEGHSDSGKRRGMKVVDVSILMPYESLHAFEFQHLEEVTS